MPNHMHLIMAPQSLTGSLARSARPTSIYWLRQRPRALDRALFPATLCFGGLDDAHLIAAARYVALNPVGARLVAQAQDWA